MEFGRALWYVHSCHRATRSLKDRKHDFGHVTRRFVHQRHETRRVVRAAARAAFMIYRAVAHVDGAKLGSFAPEMWDPFRSAKLQPLAAT